MFQMVYINNILTLRSYSVFDILLPLIIIMMQDCWQALNTYKCLSSLSCGGVSNMLLVLFITFYCHTIYGVEGVQLTHFNLGDWKDKL